MTTAAARDLPGPPPTPVLGARGNLMRFLRDPIGFIERVHRVYGPLASVARGSSAAVFALRPEHSHHVLTDTELFHSPSALLFPVPEDSAARELDQGLVSLNGAEHRWQRALAMPAFHKRQVDKYHGDIVAITEQVLAGWARPGAADVILDVAAEMRQITLRVVNKTLFGLDPSPDADAFAGLTRTWQGMLLSPAVILLPFDLPGTPYRRALAHAERLAGYYRALLARKRADPAEQRDVMAALMAVRDDTGHALTEAQLVGEANVLFIAGHDTTSNALTWTLLLLAQHPPVLHQLLDELENTLGGVAPTVQQVRPESGELPHLDRAIKESLRLLPPVPVLTRITSAPGELDGHRLPMGTFVFLSPYMTHRTSALYPQPRRFLPERWAGLDPSPYEYLPFGAGARRCLGATLATLVLKVVLALVLQRYRLQLLPGSRIDRQVHITLSPKAGMPMLVAPQDRRFRQVPVRGTIGEMVDFGEQRAA